jgi:TonB-linked SusC/RagA family outer membrane protein
MIVKYAFKKGKKISFVIMLFLSLFMINEVSAQSGTTISGVVKDDTGFPLPGVNIIEKGTKNTSSSDMDGKFKMKLTTDKAVITVSYIGFETQSVLVSGKSVVNVSLKSSAETLGEVKIVSYGYGTIKKENLTGSVSSISAKDLAKVPVTNVAEALAGRLAGVSVQSVDGAPGADIVIRVRGGGSITQDNSPLYVVDGFIVSNLNDIPPGDIASIDVLKDAATTAIYGAQGANGVVVVTTKKPKGGKTTITYNNYVQINTLPKERKYEVLSPYEFATMQYETAKMSTTSTTNTALDNFEKYYGKFDDLELYKSKKPNDWQKDVLGQPVFSFYNNLSISGGSDSTKFLISYSANKDGGLLLGSGQKRDVLNFKLSHDISKKLKLDLTSRISNRIVNGAGTSGGSQIRIKDLITKRPTNGLADELDLSGASTSGDDEYSQFLTTFIDPVELVKQDWRKKSTRDYVVGAGITWNILSNLTYKSSLNIGKTFGISERFYGPLTSESKNNGNNLPVGVKTDSYDFSYRFTNTVNYDFKNLGKSNLGILLGQEVRSKGGTNQQLRSEDFRASITPEELFANMGLGTIDPTNTYTSVDTDENASSLFGRADYSYNDKYLFTATIRRDVSSKFAKDNNVGIFPALSAGWKISSEPFLKDSKYVEELKLRISYGEVGNDRIPANSTSLLYKVGVGDNVGFGNASNVYYTPLGTTLFNPNLKWETTISRNIGLDFRLFKSAINGSLDVYRNTTKDLLFQSNISLVSGFATKWDNIGNTSNQGVELSLNANIINKKDFTLGFNFNVGMNKAKIDALDGTNDRFFQSNWASTDLKEQNDYYIAVGQTIGQIIGYSNGGMYTVNDFDSYNSITGKYVLKAGVPDASSLLNASVKPGSMKIADSNGDGLIDVKDTHVIGNALAKAQGGFGLSGNYKGFDLSAFFNWSYGNDVYNTGKVDYNQLYRTTYGNMLNTMNSANRFTYIDMDGTYTGTAGSVVTDLVQLGEMNKNKTIWSGNTSFGGSRAVLTDWAIEDGSYIRLNTIISTVRFYVTGSNLALWTKYSGYDPDVNTSRSSDSGGFGGLTPGLDYSSYPRSRTFTFGLNATF